jgi:hypothetical protein
MIVVFDHSASDPFVKLFLSLLHSLIIVAYSGLCEFCSTLILHLPIICVPRNPTLVVALKIG